MRLVIASGNVHKIQEIERYLKPLGWEAVSVHDLLPEYISPEETGSTLEENALLKARDVFEKLPQEWIVADDSGLFVEALGGDPGVYSARYAGEDADDTKNNAKLIVKLEGKVGTERNAAFRSCIALVNPQGEKLFQGRIEGGILEEPRGKSGFGYDPYFLPHGREESFAEMSLKEKNKISHRARALEALVQYLREL